jgi:hypothetical protein
MCARTFPDGLDPAQAVGYEEVTPNITGRWLVWPDKSVVCRQRPDNLYLLSMYSPDDFNSQSGPRSHNGW